MRSATRFQRFGLLFLVGLLVIGITVPTAWGQRGPGKPKDSDEGYGNNLSNPVVFSEGIGLLGLPVSFELGERDYYATGLRPTLVEADPPEVTALPYAYFVDPPFCITVDGVTVCAYPQRAESAWQAEWVDATLDENVVMTEVDWSDNLVRQTWTTRSVVRVEVVLNALPEQYAPMEGFETVYLLGQGKTELQGATGVLGDYLPTVYSVCPRLTIQKLGLDGNGDPTVPLDPPLHNGAIYENFGTDGPGGYSAEVNVGGKLIYGFNWMLRNDELPPDGQRDGWYRITFSLDSQAAYSLDGQNYVVDLNTELTQLNALDTDPNDTGIQYRPMIDTENATSYIDVYIKANKGGGKKPK